MLSHKNKFIHFEIPKTGSSSVRCTLKPYYDKSTDPGWYGYLRRGRVEIPWRNGKRDHSAIPGLYRHIRPEGVQRYFKDMGWDYDSYHKFTFVRNTWSRVVSMYMFRCKEFKRRKEDHRGDV